MPIIEPRPDDRIEVSQKTIDHLKTAVESTAAHLAGYWGREQHELTARATLIDVSTRMVDLLARLRPPVVSEDERQSSAKTKRRSTTSTQGDDSDNETTDRSDDEAGTTRRPGP